MSANHSLDIDSKSQNKHRDYSVEKYWDRDSFVKLQSIDNKFGLRWNEMMQDGDSSMLYFRLFLSSLIFGSFFFLTFTLESKEFYEYININ